MNYHFSMTDLETGSLFEGTCRVFEYLEYIIVDTVFLQVTI